MSECCRINGIECELGLNKSKCPHHVSPDKILQNYRLNQ